MNVQSEIEQKLQSLDPVFVEVANESHMHNVPDNSETHFKVTVVSDQFNGKMLVARHRLVNQLLADQLSAGVHALSLHTKTPDEWFEQGGTTPDSPLCMGGSAAEKSH